jgi:hypothetical protein
MRKNVLAAIGLAMGLGLTAAHAQSDQAATAPAPQAQAGVPGRGLSMAQVEQRYGPASTRLAAVGQPPITRWVYPSFVVYFEYNLVIHAVASQAVASTN